MSDLFRYTNFPDEPADYESQQDEIADLLEKNREQAESLDIVRAERDRAQEELIQIGELITLDEGESVYHGIQVMIDTLIIDADTLRAERDRLLVEDQLMKYLPIPTIAEIYPHPDPVYGHCFKWPAEEVDQFMEMLPE